MANETWWPTYKRFTRESGVQEIPVGDLLRRIERLEKSVLPVRRWDSWYDEQTCRKYGLFKDDDIKARAANRAVADALRGWFQKQSEKPRIRVKAKSRRV